MIKGINESNALAKHISCWCRYEFDGMKHNLREKWDNDKCQCQCKKPIKYRTCENDYAWNPSTCPCGCDKGCQIGKYLKDCECMKNLVDDLVVTSDDTAIIPETTLINSSERINYWLIGVVPISCLISLVVVVFKYYIKHALKMSCLL